MTTGVKIGDSVLVASLGQSGVITEDLGKGRYRVAIGNLMITAQISDLSPTTPRARKREPEVERFIAAKGRPTPPTSLDLHGLTVDEALRKLEKWLDTVVLSDLSQVKVIHGLGTGRVQGAVHTFLQSQKVVRHFKLNPWNPGETDIYL